MQEKDITAALGVNQDIIDQRKARLADRQVSISCVVPAMNEQQCIGEFIAQASVELSKLTNNWELVVVDDGSTDATLLTAQQALADLDNGSAQLLSLSRNFGKEAAIAAGLKASRGELVILMDADFQHPLSLLQKFIDAWQLGYDHAYAVKEDLHREFFLRRLGRSLFHSLLKFSSSFDIPYGAEDFRLFDRKMVEALNDCKEQDKFMKGLYAFVGFRSYAVAFKKPERHAGESNFKAWRLTRFAAAGFLSFSSLPLRIWSVSGVIISFLSLCSALYIIIKTLILGIDVPGYASLLVAVIFFGGVQLLSIGVLGEYISRIFREVKPRPAFIIQDKTDLGKPWQQ